MADLRIPRWQSTTTTWIRKTVALVRWMHDDDQAATPETRFLASYYGLHLLESMLFEAELLVGVIEPSMIEDCERRAKRLAQMLRARRLSEALGNVDGRTVGEREAFEEKAAQMLCVAAEKERTDG